MPRPCCLRYVGSQPPAGFFKPAGVPACSLEQVTLTLDEVEALRLADWEGLYQEQAAGEMKISRPTFARIIEAARRKVADALIHGKALRLEGGVVQMKEKKENQNHESSHSCCRRSRFGKPGVRALRVGTRLCPGRLGHDERGSAG
jgi:predicted DNA-binding protein (UPF0251 family)